MFMKLILEINKKDLSSFNTGIFAKKKLCTISLITFFIIFYEYSN